MRHKITSYSLLIVLAVIVASCTTDPTPQKVFYADRASILFSDGDNVWEPLLTSEERQAEAYRSELGPAPEFSVGSSGLLKWDTSYSVLITLTNFTDKQEAYDIQDDNATIRFKLFQNNRAIFDHNAEVGEVFITGIDTSGDTRWIFGEFTAELDSRSEIPEPRIIKGTFDCKFNSSW